MLKRSAALALFAATAGGLASPAALAAIGGLITQAGTGTAPTADAYVQLNRCSYAGNELCDQSTDFTTSRNGQYSFKRAYEPGRYQVVVTSEGSLATHSATFDVVARENHRIDLALDAIPVRHADITRCEQPDAQGLCAISFKLKNVSAQALDLDAWIVVATTSPVPTGWSRYSFGNKTPQATQVTLAPGAETTVVQKVYVGKDLASGAYATLEMYVAEHGSPDKTLVYDYFPALIVGSPNAATNAELAAKRLEHQRRAVTMTAGQRNQATANKRYVYVGVGDAVTREPLPLSVAPKLRLMACDQPTDDYCRWIEGDEQPVSESGLMIIDTKGMFPGRYQIQTRANQNYAYTHSATFEVPLVNGPLKIEMPMSLVPVAVEGAQTCEAQPPDSCVLKYQLRNTTSEPLSVALWVYNYMLTSESSVGTSVYSQGRKGQANGTPVTVTIAPGATTIVQQPVGMQDVASGSSGWLQLYIADKQDIAYGEGLYRLGNYTLYEEDGRKMINFTPFPFPQGGPAPTSLGAKAR